MPTGKRPTGQGSEPSGRGHWLLLADPRSWNWLKDGRDWAFPVQTPRLGEIRKGDLAVVYVMKRSSLVAILEFEGQPRPAERAVPMDERELNQVFPTRVRIRYLSVPRLGVKFEGLARSMSFVRHKEHWGVYFQGKPIRRLTQSDFLLISRAIVAASKQD